MSVRRRTGRDQRRRSLGQHLLADPSAVSRLVRAVDVRPDDLVVDLGAGRGALTLPLAHAGARVIAVEIDRACVARLEDRLERAGLADRVRVLHTDLRTFRAPHGPWRVVANPPFGHTTALLRQLLDDPARGPDRADLVVQLEVARKRTRRPPTTLHSAAWAPWWSFEMGPRIDRRAFRPVPGVDAALLMIRRREPAVLPPWLAADFTDALRTIWTPPPDRRRPAR